MRAKVAVVVLVIFGLLGAFAITASVGDRAQVAGDAFVLTDTGDTTAGTVTPSMRDKDRDDDHHDADDEHTCIAKDETLIGPVCVDADIISVEDVLTT